MTTERSLRIGEGILGGGVLALGIFIAVQTSRFEVGPSHAAVGPRLFPFLIAAGLIIVGLALLYQGLFGHIAHEGGFELDWPAVAFVCRRAHRADAAARASWAGLSPPRSCSSPSRARSGAGGRWSTSPLGWR